MDRFPLDAAILFSDILTIPDAMGLGLSFNEGEGPRFERPLRTAADINALPIPDPEDELRYVMDAVRLIRRELNGRVPLIGFLRQSLDAGDLYGRRWQFQPGFHDRSRPCSTTSRRCCIAAR